MRKKFKPSISINESVQNFLLKVTESYGNDYEKLSDSMKSVITKFDFEDIISRSNNSALSPRFSKLFVLVDYINAFTSGSLGSKAARDIEDNVYNALNAAINDEDTAVVILIDSHLNDEAYLQCNEGKFLPVLHANTEEERLLYGKVGMLLSNYYCDSTEEYVSSSSEGIWFVYKSNWGTNDITSDMNLNISRAVDKVMTLANDEDLEAASEEMGPNYDWNMTYDTVCNLSAMEFDPEVITIAGVATNICVLSNAIVLQTQYPEAKLQILENAIASYDQDLHNKAIDIMKGLRMKFITA